MDEEQLIPDHDELFDHYALLIQDAQAADSPVEALLSASSSSSAASAASSKDGGGGGGGGAATAGPSSGPASSAAATGPYTVPEKPREQTVSIACLSCRSRHIKCDGQNPCNRCVASDIHCSYIASRRGLRKPRPLPDVPGAGDASSSSDSHSHSHSQAASRVTLPGGSSAAAPFHRESLNERSVSAFFHYFFAAHPFAIPKQHFQQLVGVAPVEPLLAAVRWVGSLFLNLPLDATGQLYARASSLALSDAPRDGFLVQALLLLTIGLDGCGELEAARQMLESAGKLALEIGMNKRQFAAQHGRGARLLEESWRRTWWYLFIVDGMIAGMHQETTFPLFDAEADVDLPCEELYYLHNDIPAALPCSHLDEPEFNRSSELSSFAYCILSARNLGTLLRLQGIADPEDERVQQMERRLTNWRLHVPSSKRDALRPDEKCDEIMFQAYILSHAASILLHRPFSHLDPAYLHVVTTCEPPKSHPALSNRFNTHTKHVATSATALSNMIIHRTPLLHHTHFFVCAVTLSSTIHLSRWNLTAVESSHADQDDLRQLIRVNIGALNKISAVWICAQRAEAQIQRVAQEIYNNISSMEAQRLLAVTGSQEQHEQGGTSS